VEFDAFGGYSVLKDATGAPAILGHGVWGTVHKAFNNDLRCYAALRMIARSAFPGDEVRDQFVSEVRSAAHIHHPSLASIFPLELIEDKYLYATEFCDGEILAERIARDGRLGTIPALDIVGQIAAGLDVASSAGLIHRNITAENIMLVQEDEEVAVKVLDLALPARKLAGNALRHDCDFSSPEESAGKVVDVRSGVYSLGALLYYIQAGAEKYALFRAKSVANEEVSFDDGMDFSPRVLAILKTALRNDPGERIATFAELRDAIHEVLIAPKRIKSEVAARPVEAEPVDSAAATQALPSSESRGEVGAEKKVAPIGRVERATPKASGLMIPLGLLGSAQAGTVLRLKRESETGEQLVACVRNRFRIGRSAAAGADLATRFLPRTKANDTKTKRLSRIHVTAKCEKGQVLLFDGDSVTPSANGSTFDAQALSTETPLTLLKPGTLRLAEVFSIRVIPRTLGHGDAPMIANLGDWKGPARESNPPVAGAIVFAPNDLNEIRVAVWLFSVAPFGSSGASPLDFALTASDREIGALRYYRGCFWIEQRSAGFVSINGLALAPAEIAPLVTGQTLEVSGSRYTVTIEDVIDVRPHEGDN
jgi:serine/threonine protein kinase